MTFSKVTMKPRVNFWRDLETGSKGIQRWILMIPVVKGLLKVNFVTKAWPDIQRKLQKVEGWNEQLLENLLRETQKVYVKKETKSKK